MTCRTALPEHLCPLCGQPNGCAPAGTGRLDTPCWCASVTIAAGVLDRIPAAQRGRACLCRSCATGAPVQAPAAQTSSADAPRDAG
jgi:hypothetical protein